MYNIIETNVVTVNTNVIRRVIIDNSLYSYGSRKFNTRYRVDTDNTKIIADIINKNLFFIILVDLAIFI